MPARTAAVKRRCDHQKCGNTSDGHRPLMDPAFGRGTAAAHSDTKAITQNEKWKLSDATDVVANWQKEFIRFFLSNAHVVGQSIF